MENLKNWAKANQLLDDESVILGIAQDHPETTRPENCRYDACLVVSDDICIRDDSVRQGTIAGGKYAVFTIDHTAEAVEQAWVEIFPELQRQGHQIGAAKPIMERYSAKTVKLHKCEICVPVN
jgi:DNA gyrase inhibitor GyrI